MDIKIKFSHKELKRRAAACLNVAIEQILSVYPTMGGRQYYVVMSSYSWRAKKKTKTLTIWQIVDVLPLKEEQVKGSWNLEMFGDIKSLCHLFGFDNVPKSFDEVKAKYRLLAKLHHPDTGGSNEKFLELQVAYERWQEYLAE